jgi:hypothetical protein
LNHQKRGGIYAEVVLSCSEAVRVLYKPSRENPREEIKSRRKKDPGEGKPRTKKEKPKGDKTASREIPGK